MPVTARALASGIGTGALATAFTVPANTTVVVQRWSFNNTTAGALPLTVAVNNGSTDRDMLTTYNIAAMSPYSPDELNGIVVPTGGSVKINCAAGITYWLSGIFVTQQG